MASDSSRREFIGTVLPAAGALVAASASPALSRDEMKQVSEPVSSAGLTFPKHTRYLWLLGDPEAGWIPDADEEKRLHELLQNAHGKRGSALIFHYGLKVVALPELPNLPPSDADLWLYQIGDPEAGWVPEVKDEALLARRLDNVALHPNSSLFYHYALTATRVPGFHLMPKEAFQVDPFAGEPA